MSKKLIIFLIVCFISFTAILITYNLLSNSNKTIITFFQQVPTPVSTQLAIISVDPKPNSIEVSPVTNISITLNYLAGNPSFILQTKPELKYTLQSKQGNTIIFKPQQDLLPNTTYQINLSSPINYSWTFTTRAPVAEENIEYIRAAQASLPGEIAAYKKDLNKNYLIHKLPYAQNAFSVSYDLPNDIFTISSFSQTGKEDALKWIKSQGVDPQILTIFYN